jgi:excisionase family DNA binding protein
MKVEDGIPIHLPGQPWTVPQASAFLQVSDKHLNNLIAENRVRVIRLGRRVLLADDTVRKIATEGVPR